MARSRLYPGFPSEQGWQLEKGTTRKAKVWIRWIVDDQSQSIGKMVVQREAHVWRALVGYRYGKEWSYESIGEYPSATHAMSAAIAYLSKGKHNPGARWHDSKQREADQLDRAATKKWQQDFYHGKSVAHSESSLVAKSLGMNPHKRSRGRWYWGKLKAMKGSAAAFYSARKPTPRSHGSIFSSVTGPFYSRETAEDNIRYFGWALEREHWLTPHAKSGIPGNNPRRSPSFKAGFNYAKWGDTEQQEGFDGPINIEKMLTRSLGMPPDDYRFLRDRGITPNDREYWEGYNSYWSETIQRLKRLKRTKRPERPKRSKSTAQKRSASLTNPRRPHGKFRSCVRQVSRQRPRVRDPKAVCGAALSEYHSLYRTAMKQVSDPVRAKKMVERWYQGKLQSETIRAQRNPIAIYGLGNPRVNGRISAKIEGVIYNRVVEIKAEKTGYRPGYYRHTFSRKNQVKIFGLDNGDLLLHSTAGVKLWQPQ